MQFWLAVKVTWSEQNCSMCQAKDNTQQGHSILQYLKHCFVINKQMEPSGRV